MSRQDVDAPQRIRRPKVKSSTHRPSPTCSSPRPRGRPDGSLGRPSQQGNVNDAAWPVPPETRVVPSCARTVRDIALGWYRPPRVGRFRKTAVSGTNARGAGDGGSDKLIAWPREGHRIISGQIARYPAWAQRIFSRGEWQHARQPVLPGPRGVVGNRQDSGHRIFCPARAPNTGKATSSAPSALAASDMETGSPHGVSPGRASEGAGYGRSPLRDRSLRWSCLEEQVLSRSCYRSTFVALRNAFLLVESTRPAPPASSGSATRARAPAPISRFTPGAPSRPGPLRAAHRIQSTRPRMTRPSRNNGPGRGRALLPPRPLSRHFLRAVPCGAEEEDRQDCDYDIWNTQVRAAELLLDSEGPMRRLAVDKTRIRITSGVVGACALLR